MAFVMEKIPMEKWKFVNKYLPKKQLSEYSIWKVDYEREAYWIGVGGNTYEHLEYYVLIWKGRKTCVQTYGWIDSIDDKDYVFKNIILFQADALLEGDKEELVQIVLDAMQSGYKNGLVIKEMAEPDFSREIP